MAGHLHRGVVGKAMHDTRGANRLDDWGALSALVDCHAWRMWTKETLYRINLLDLMWRARQKERNGFLEPEDLKRTRKRFQLDCLEQNIDLVVC